MLKPRKASTLSKALAKDTESVSTDIIKGKAVSYLALGAEIKKLTAQKKELAEELKNVAIKLGTDKDRSSILVVGGYEVGNVAALSDDIDAEAALNFLEGKGLLEACTSRVLDKEAINMCVQSEEISVEDLQSFMTEKISYRISVKKVKNA